MPASSAIPATSTSPRPSEAGRQPLETEGCPINTLRLKRLGARMISRRAFAALGLSVTATGISSPGLADVQTEPTPLRPVISVLSIDGGGLRGIASAAMLAELQILLQERHGLDLIDCFDVFSGTSTGSIIAAGLALSKDRSKPFWRPDRIVDIYRSKACTIFGPRPRSSFLDRSRQSWDSHGLTSVLIDAFGDTKLSELPGNLIVPYYDLTAQIGHSAVVRMGGPLQDRDFDLDFQSPVNIHPHDDRVRDVVQASCSAPTYFNPFPVAASNHLGVDGGVFANNPALVAWANVQRRYPGSDILVTSLGSGVKRFDYRPNVTWGAWEWIDPTRGSPIMDVLTRGQSEVVHAQMSVIMEEGNYFRLQFPLPADVPLWPADEIEPSDLNPRLGRLDDADDDNLDALESLGRRAILRRSTATYVGALVDALAARREILAANPERGIPGSQAD